jgi:hypothetical protein
MAKIMGMENEHREHGTHKQQVVRKALDICAEVEPNTPNPVSFQLVNGNLRLDGCTDSRDVSLWIRLKQLAHKILFINPACQLRASLLFFNQVV